MISRIGAHLAATALEYRCRIFLQITRKLCTFAALLRGNIYVSPGELIGTMVIIEKDIYMRYNNIIIYYEQVVDGFENR